MCAQYLKLTYLMVKDGMFAPKARTKRKESSLKASNQHSTTVHSRTVRQEKDKLFFKAKYVRIEIKFPLSINYMIVVGKEKLFSLYLCRSLAEIKDKLIKEKQIKV